MALLEGEEISHRGVTFDYLEANITAVRWLGQGPYRVWKNRLAGQEIGVCRKLANNTNPSPQSEPNTTTALHTGARDFYFGAFQVPTVDRDADGRTLRRLATTLRQSFHESEWPVRVRSKLDSMF